MSAKPDLSRGISVQQLEGGKPVAGSFEGQDVIVMQLPDGRLRAVSGACTHLGAPLETGAVIDGEIRCPWHHARFSLEDGQAVGGPALESLGCFAAEEADGLVRVTGRRHIEAPRPELTVPSPVVIVGNGGAGYALADMLSRYGLGEQVLLIGDEADGPYDRTFLSKQYLAGKASRVDFAMPAPGQGLGLPAELRTSARVTAIDRANRKITVQPADDGGHAQTIAYGTLVLATGAEAQIPDFPGAERDDVFILRDLADADALLAAAMKGKRAVIMGASFIGLEVAAALVQQGLSVSVVDKEDVPLASTLGDEAGRFVQTLHEEKGVNFHLGRTIAGFDGQAVWLDDGQRLTAQLFVVGAGVKPRVDLAKDAGLELAEDNGGVTVDDALRTSDPHIYAAGDIASYPDPRLGRALRVEHWVHAQRMGQFLARRFTGQSNAGFGDTPFFWSGHYGTQLRYVGHAPAEDRKIEGDVSSGDFAVTYRVDGKDKALLSCQRDIEALEREAKWDRPDNA